MIEILPVNESWVRISCEPGIAKELDDYFQFAIPGAKFMAAYRKKHWNGKIHLFKLRQHLLYRGLVPRLETFAQDRAYGVTNHLPALTGPPNETILRAIDHLGLEHTPRDYQLDAVVSCLQQRRQVVLSPTGSGKSLIIYILTQLLKVPTLVVVPTISLVSQMASDFADYGLDVDQHIRVVQGGTDKYDASKTIHVSTWQSIYELPEDHFNQFKMIIVDECHLAKAKSLSGLMEKATKVPFRFGFTGTLDDLQCHQLQLEGLFGSVNRVASTQQLIQTQHLTPLNVKVCVLGYDDATKKQHRHDTYQEEIDFLLAHPARDAMIAKLVHTLPGNTLVLFQFVEKHGLQLVERIKKTTTKTVHYIDGSLSAEDRERIRHTMERDSDQILVASYGTMSLGVNITNLDNLIFSSPSKSKIRVIQSIGRTLRIRPGKTHATLYDLVDDLRVGKHINYTFKHAQLRLEYYTTERFPFALHQFPLHQFTI